MTEIPLPAGTREPGIAATGTARCAGADRDRPPLVAAATRCAGSSSVGHFLQIAMMMTKPSRS